MIEEMTETLTIAYSREDGYIVARSKDLQRAVKNHLEGVQYVRKDLVDQLVEGLGNLIKEYENHEDNAYCELNVEYGVLQKAKAALALVKVSQ